MVGTLSYVLGTLVFKAPDSFTYFLDHWKTDPISISVIMVAVLLLSGYFYGCVFQRFCKPLKNTDCTFLGVMFIIAVFQIYTFYALSLKVSTSIGLLLFKILVFGGPVSCLVTLTKPLPTWKHLISLLLSICVALILGIASSKLNTNNIFFDSVYYLSEVLENSEKAYFGSMNYYTGVAGYAFDKFHDLQCYYYLVAVAIRWAVDVFKYTESITPIYIWFASILYWCSIAHIVVSSVYVLWKKWKWKGLLFGLCLISPYYTNYFNTTLAFFGNTMRTTLIGFTLLYAYLFIKSKDKWMFIPLMVSFYAGIGVSSTSFFLIAFICAGLFFWMCLYGIEDWKTWELFILSCTPVIHYAVIVLDSNYTYYKKTEGVTVAAITILLLIAFLIRKHFKVFNTIGKVMYPIVFIGLLVSSFLLRNGSFPYSYYFVSRSANDMCNNFTSHLSNLELFRNILFYALLICFFINFKKNNRFKMFMVLIALLFLNPLTQPAVSTFLTSEVYSRSFDLLVNPFFLIFLLFNLDKLLENKLVLNWIVFLTIGVFSFYLGEENWKDYYSRNLIFKDEGYNWETKVSEDSMEMYKYIQKTLGTDTENRPLILSQDVSLKAYVSNIHLEYAANDFREIMDNEELYKQHHDLMTLLYPEKITLDTLIKGEEGDYSKLEDLINQCQSDYLLMRNTISIWNERGWFEKAYAQSVKLGQLIPLEENDTWILFKIDRSYKEAIEAEAKDREKRAAEALSNRNDPNAEAKSNCILEWGEWDDSARECVWAE